MEDEQIDFKSDGKCRFYKEIEIIEFSGIILVIENIKFKFFSASLFK